MFKKLANWFWSLWSPKVEVKTLKSVQLQRGYIVTPQGTILPPAISLGGGDYYSPAFSVDKASKVIINHSIQLDTDSEDFIEQLTKLIPLPPSYWESSPQTSYL